MRICMVHNCYGRTSGEEIVVNATIDLLRQKQHEVIPFIKSSQEIQKMNFGKTRAFFNGIYSRSSRRTMREMLAESKPDIVHVHNLYPLISPSVLPICRAMGFPVVMTVHNYRLICPNGLFMKDGHICEKCSGGHEWWCLLKNCEEDYFKSFSYALRNYIARTRGFYKKNVKAYIALTEFQRQHLIRAGYPVDRIHVIPNAVDPVTSISVDIAGDYVGYVGRVSPEKDISTLVKSARSCENIPFKAAGSYDRMPQVLGQAPANFEFCGCLDKKHLVEFYKNSRIIVLSSVCYEGFPSVLAEAMSYGKPVICSRIGGLSEIVDDGVTGLLFEPGNPVDLAKKIKYLWDRPKLCSHIGQAGHAKALKEYTSESYYERLITVYEKAIRINSS